jgi:TonB family protein
MEALVTYLLRSAIWITGFALVYGLFLRDERFFLLNRIYLVTGILASLILPFVTVRYIIEVPAMQAGTSAGADSIGSGSVTSGISTGSLILAAFWTAGALFTVVRQLVRTLTVVKTINKSEIISTHPVKLIRSADNVTPFSFFSFVFVNPSLKDIETREIMNHEMVHVKQMHWLDLLLSGLLCTVQWFNPVVWIYSRFIRQNHEYLADEAALQRTSDPAVYRATLLNQIAGSPVIELGNSFNYSLNKKRFTMMKNIISSPYRKLRLLMILPVFALLLYAFAEPEYRLATSDRGQAPPDAMVATVTKEIRGIVVQEDGKPLAGAAIIVKGTTMGTMSDENGKFRLVNVPDDGVLVITYVGFESKVMQAVSGTDMTVKMLRKPVAIDTVQVPPPPPPPPPGSKQMAVPPPPPPPPAADKSTGTTKASAPETEGEKYVMVEEMPEFPGGEKEMMTWISSNVKYPPEAVKNKISGLVLVSFTVSGTGKVQNVKTVRGVTPALDEEAVRVIKSMPDWKPGRQQGKPIDVEYTVPVQFMLEGKTTLKVTK